MDNVISQQGRFSRRSVLLTAVSSMVVAACGHKDNKPIIIGKRIDVFSSGAGLMVDHSDKTPIIIPPPLIDQKWMQEGRTPDHASVHSAVGGVRKMWKQRH